mmetsp:Transcript_23497/g.55689  ORF Transcript_23497/g.55689 Transcript_23497/m.55689 type:complete len:382 (-) Transcript_23497:100-1245(-)
MSYYGHQGNDANNGNDSTQQHQQAVSPHGGGGGGGGGRPQITYEATKIFVGGLSWSTNEESLKFHFQQYGPVASVEVMRDRNTGDPRGFAFVVFTNAETVDLVMDEQRRNGHMINHKLVDVKRAQARGVAPPSIHKGDGTDGGGGDDGGGGHTPNHRSSFGSSGHHRHGGSASQDGGGGQDELTPEQKGNKIFVGGIPPEVDREELKEIFERFGPVVDAIVMIDQVSQRSRCFGFVTFEDGHQAAQKAVDAQPIDVHDVTTGTIRKVEIRLATPKNEQRRAPPAAGSKHIGLRAGMSSGPSTGPYGGLAVAYGRQGWKAGYGSFAFGQAGWGVQGWEDFNKKLPQRSGFSFKMINDEYWPLPNEVQEQQPPPAKRVKIDEY